MSGARAVPVLMYHHVSPNPGLVTVSPATFTAQMEYLAASGYSTLGADHFLEFLERKREAPRRSVLITFDDGYLDNYVHAYPALRRLGLRGVIFAVTGWIGDGEPRPHAGAATVPECPDHRGCKAAIATGEADRVMLRWSEIRLMEQAGVFETHSHTHTHTRWDQKIADPRERLGGLEQDLLRSRSVLKERLGKDTRHLCWPQGYFEPGYQEVAKKLGFRALYTVEKGVNAPGTDAARIPRIVAKDRAGRWFGSRLWIYSRPGVGALYARLRGN